ncbi:hypothetical protein BLNAU_5118 [Blattamonas nauphoetae]|uniref:Uncharacterized protein n=1 Tax=Blattamonas nauphoetae TaxID=2049346 RepID=A0ABQ9Y830_9EUKA|nr:hypothetical protein BLNAU_5118 [Blattamonas nauphoetae]
MLAVVSVTTTEEIGGTMGVLLNDLNVPRLVHVVFGTETKPSTTGTAVVSSGPNGILPVAEYTPLNSSLCSALFPPPTVLNCVCSLSDAEHSPLNSSLCSALFPPPTVLNCVCSLSDAEHSPLNSSLCSALFPPPTVLNCVCSLSDAEHSPLNSSLCSALFPPPTVLNCVCSLSDANTSLVVASRMCLEDGDYLMKVKKGQDGEEKEISLTWVNSRTLQGTPLPHFSTLLLPFSSPLAMVSSNTSVSSLQVTHLTHRQ